jgi:hypothetical protein
VNYFARLAQSAGIAAPRGTPAAAGIAPAAGDTAATPEVMALEQTVEVAAPLSPPAPEAVSVPAEAPPVAAAEAGEARIVLAVPPAPAPAASRPALETDDAPREQQSIVSVVTPEPERGTPVNARPTIATRSARAAANADVLPPSEPPSAPAATTAADTIDVEVPVPAARPSAPTDRPRSETAASPRRPPLTRDEVSSVDAVLPVEEAMPVDNRTRGADDAPPHRFVHAPPGERRPHTEPTRRDGPVEIRIGTVTLQVHAPTVQTPAPARDGFAPHRHYLRLW